MFFQNRQEAGRLLAEQLAQYKNRQDLLVLAIPRGGVVVGYEVARALGAPLDVYITRKVGAPHNPELAIGAVASDGTLVLDHNLIDLLGVSRDYIEEEASKERAEIQRRLAKYRGERSSPQIEGKVAILVDDGIATGATVSATIQALRKSNPKELVLAIPVGPRDTVERLKVQTDKLICLHAPEVFWAVGSFYLDFGQTTDEEVISLLQPFAPEAKTPASN